MKEACHLSFVGRLSREHLDLLKASEAKREFAKRLEDMDNGDYISMEDLRKEAKTW